VPARRDPGEPLSLFAITAPGLEAVCADELRRLALASTGEEPGGVAFTADFEGLYRANLSLRTSSRVLVRVAEFTARTFFDLERLARNVPWERYLARGRPVRFRVTCRKSKLYHSDAVAERLASAAALKTGAAVGSGDADDEDDTRQLFVVRVLHDRVTISADSSGALLHLRGYRQAIAKAPLRETLAAAMLLASGWHSETPLLDPLCGAGTIPIEGALLARRIAPGLASARRFAFMDWPDFDRRVWERVRERALDAVLPAAAAPILGSDRDAGAIVAAIANAERAGVAGDIAFSERAVSAIEPPTDPGWVVTNPPYGIRLGEGARGVRDLYAQLGNVVRRRCPGWTVALLSPDRQLDQQLGIPMEDLLRTTNGGISVRLVAGRVGRQERALTTNKAI
jgi:putative N6-adenine-specific DNA methylase